MGGYYPLSIQCGSRRVIVVTYKDASGVVPNTGWGARFMMREKRDPTSAAAITQLIAGAGITIGGANGRFTVVLTPTVTLALTLFAGWYELMADPDGAKSDNSFQLLESPWVATRNVAT